MRKPTLLLLPFSEKQIKDAVNSTSTLTAAAKKLSTASEKVTAQQLRGWLARLDDQELSQIDNAVRNLQSKRVFQTENNKLRSDLRTALDAVGTREDFFSAAERLVAEMPARPPIDYRDYVGGQAGTPMTVEVLLSDLQIGKLAHNYNTAVARKRLEEFGRAVRFQIEQKKAVGYRIEEIVLALVGDIIESDKKHKNSARATDTGTAEQMYDATSGIFELVVEPLARLGIPLRVICITGNHDWDDHGLAMFRPGREQLSFPLYKLLEMVTVRSGYRNVTYNIPDGSYVVESIYGQYVLYEHGVGVANNEAAMKAHKIKRAEQERKHITYFRMGDKHVVTAYNAGQLVVNGAFFGAAAGGTEYSGIAGYSSVAAQWMGFHVPRQDERLTLYDTFTIQLEHIV